MRTGIGNYLCELKNQRGIALTFDDIGAIMEDLRAKRNPGSSPCNSRPPCAVPFLQFILFIHVNLPRVRLSSSVNPHISPVPQLFG
jgi:hypothetical protein